MNLLSNLLLNKPKPENVGIALSGGGVRGIAHLGVLKALNENGIFPEIISGVSAGALIAVFYAEGYKPDEIFEIFNKTSLFHFARITLPRKGLLNLDKVSVILHEYLLARTFEDLKIPLYVAATNLNEGKVEYFHEGKLIDKILASASIPILFKPSLINGTTYVDGGLFDNLPVNPIRDKCGFLIGSHVNPLSKKVVLDNLLGIAERTFHLAIGASVRENSKSCNLFIEPNELMHYALLKLEKTRDIFDIGYTFTSNLLEKNMPL